MKQSWSKGVGTMSFTFCNEEYRTHQNLSFSTFFRVDNWSSTHRLRSRLYFLKSKLEWCSISLPLSFE